MHRTLRLKVKPESYAWLNKAAKEVNYVWNWCNETSQKASCRYVGAPIWLSGFDLMKLSTGATYYFDHIGADTVNRTCGQYVVKRRAAKAHRLRWRASGGSRRSLGWIPFKAENIQKKSRGIRFAGKAFRVFEFASLAGAKWGDGEFSQDAVGDWWLCLPVIVDAIAEPAPRDLVGIDLGLKDTATTSDGERLAAGRYFRATEAAIAQAQRRGHKRQAKRLHRKVSRQRRDTIHKFTAGVVRNYQNIVVGDVSSIKLARTRMAKSVLDSGWGLLRQQLLYKGERAGRAVHIVNEAYTSRTCSSCGSLSGPKGVNGLRVREWACVDCGEVHDRDVNAARNIALLAPRQSASVCGNESRYGMNVGRAWEESKP